MSVRARFPFASDEADEEEEEDGVVVVEGRWPGVGGGVVSEDAVDAVRAVGAVEDVEDVTDAEEDAEEDADDEVVGSEVERLVPAGASFAEPSSSSL
jgi:hypothetical protein